MAQALPHSDPEREPGRTRAAPRLIEHRSRLVVSVQLVSVVLLMCVIVAVTAGGVFAMILLQVFPSH